VKHSINVLCLNLYLFRWSYSLLHSLFVRYASERMQKESTTGLFSDLFPPRCETPTALSDYWSRKVLLLFTPVF
jgi:hypothetical protein